MYEFINLTNKFADHKTTISPLTFEYRPKDGNIYVTGNTDPTFL